MLLVSVRRLAEERFGGEAPALLLAGNALHADFSPEGAGSGVFGWIMTMLGQTVGFPAPEGGAGALTGGAGPAAGVARRRGAHRRRGQRHRGEPAVAYGPCSRPTASGCRPRGRCWPTSRRPGSTGAWSAGSTCRRGPAAALRRFGWDPGTVKVDWALSGPVPWDPAPEVVPGCVHVCDGLDELTTVSAQIAAGAGAVAPVPADGADDHDRPEPLAGRHRVDVGVHPRPAAGTRRRRPRRADRRLGRRRRRAVRRPDAGADRAVRARLRRPGAGPPGAVTGRAAAARRQPGRWRRQRRHRPAAPGAGLPAGGRASAGRTPPCAGSTWPAPPPTPAAVCTARRAPMPPAPRSPARVCDASHWVGPAAPARRHRARVSRRRRRRRDSRLRRDQGPVLDREGRVALAMVLSARISPSAPYSVTSNDGEELMVSPGTTR